MARFLDIQSNTPVKVYFSPRLIDDAIIYQDPTVMVVVAPPHWREDEMFPEGMELSQEECANLLSDVLTS